MSAIANESSDSVPNNAESVPAIGSEEAVELVSLRRLTRQSAVPDRNDHPAETTAQGAPLQLVPTEPVMFSPSVASTDKFTPSRRGKAKAPAKSVAKGNPKSTENEPTPSRVSIDFV